MKNYYSISIPKPCHEDWTQMSPKEKGRFCNSCSKTVIDFTKMNTNEVQYFIAENKNNRICGHFKQTQLDSINIHIPSKVLEQQQSFHKLFLLVLLIVMGSTLMNCTNKHGDKQKIDSIEVIDSLSNKTIDVLGGIPRIYKTDTIAKVSTCKTAPKVKVIDSIAIDGELVIETTGDVEIIESPIPIDSIKVVEPPEITVDGALILGDIEIIEEPPVVGFIVAEAPPEFKNTPSKLNVQEKRDYFSKNITNFVLEHFNSTQFSNLGFSGKQKIQTQFKIDTLGFVKDIKVRAIHIDFEKETKRVLNLLPQFIPGKQNNRPETVVYNLPISFHIEE